MTQYIYQFIPLGALLVTQINLNTDIEKQSYTK